MHHILVRAARRITRTVLNLLGKYTVVSLFLFGLAIACVTGFVLGLNSILTRFVSFLLTTLGAILVWLAVPPLVRGHHWLYRRFRESVQARQSARRTCARLLTGTLLNLAYFVILYFASYQGVLKSIFPLAGIMEGVIPTGYWAATAQIWPEALILLFAGSLGPATLYTIIWFRRENGVQEPKETVLSVLQVVCYLSYLYLVLCFSTQSATQLMYFERTYLVLVLPGTLVSLAILRWFEQELRL
jgi:hypothetical protein